MVGMGVQAFAATVYGCDFLSGLNGLPAGVAEERREKKGRAASKYNHPRTKCAPKKNRNEMTWRRPQPYRKIPRIIKRAPGSRAAADSFQLARQSRSRLVKKPMSQTGRE